MCGAETAQGHAKETIVDGEANERAVQRSRGRSAPGRERRLPGGSGPQGGGRHKGRSAGKGHMWRGVRAGTHRPRTSPAWWGSSGPWRRLPGRLVPGSARPLAQRRPAEPGPLRHGSQTSRQPPNFPASPAAPSGGEGGTRREEKEGGKRLVPAPAGITCSRAGPPRGADPQGANGTRGRDTNTIGNGGSYG